MRIAERQGEGVRVKTDCDDLVGLFQGLELVGGAEANSDCTVVNTWRFHIFDDDPLPPGFARRIESKGFADADSRGRNIDFEYHRIPAEIRHSYIRLLRNLVPVARLSRRVERAAASIDFDQVACLHMRTWLADHWGRADKRHDLYFDSAAYDELVEAREAVFVACDNQASLARLRQRFGSKIKSLVPDPDIDPVEHAFIELSLLSRGVELLGSSLSTFTEMAWWLGGCKQPVTLVGARGKLFISKQESK